MYKQKTYDKCVITMHRKWLVKGWVEPVYMVLKVSQTALFVQMFTSQFILWLQISDSSGGFTS